MTQNLMFDKDELLFVEDTSSPNNAKFHNADITVVGYQNFADGDPQLRVIVFEVKPKDQIVVGHAGQAKAEMSNDKFFLAHTKVICCSMFPHIVIPTHICLPLLPRPEFVMRECW